MEVLFLLGKKTIADWFVVTFGVISHDAPLTRTIRLFLSVVGNLVNIVAKKIRTNEKVSFVTSKSRKIVFVMRLFCRGKPRGLPLGCNEGPVGSWRGLRCSPTSMPLWTNGALTAAKKRRFGLQKVAQIAIFV
ncbi:MAG: hypothetical protein IJ355_03200 [Prevotella sp.]|nr:hypothetical protein [Prevotella sp.]